MRLAVFVGWACCIAVTPAAAVAAPAAGVAPVVGVAPAAGVALTTAATPAAGADPTAVVAPAAAINTPQLGPVPVPAQMMAPAAASSAGSLLQTILALSFVLALLAALAWAMKRYGPRAGGNSATLRVVGSLSLGGRERIIVVEVADQWIVVGAAPGRVNALATMPRQPSTDSSSATGAAITQGASSATFADWLKQTIDKRHGK